jgi:hypothetical protein
MRDAHFEKFCDRRPQQMTVESERLAWLRAYLASECRYALCAGEEEWLEEYGGCTDRRYSGRRI